MNPLRSVLPLILALPVLSGCAVADLAAHGIKEYERSKEARAAEAAPEPARPVPAPQPVVQPVRAVEPSVPAVPPRESVAVEPLR